MAHLGGFQESPGSNDHRSEVRGRLQYPRKGTEPVANGRKASRNGREREERVEETRRQKTPSSAENLEQSKNWKRFLEFPPIINLELEKMACAA
jgi:hypothetical protein